MIITQLIYIKPGAEKLFNQFESLAIPLISKYNGKLLLRLRPEEKAVIENHIPAPYEVHIVEFQTEADFENFMADDERQQFVHLKEQAVLSSVLIKGTQI